MRKRVEVGIPHPCFDLEIETQQLSAVGNFHLSFSGAPRICRAAINSPEDERWDDVPRAPEPRIRESWVRSKGAGRQCSKGAPNENIRSCLSKQSLARGKTTTCWNTGSSRFAWAVICAAAEWASEFWIHVGSSTRRTSGAAATIAEIGCHDIYQFVRSGRSCGDWAKIFGCTCCILGRCQGSMTLVFTSYCKITSSSSDACFCEYLLERCSGFLASSLVIQGYAELQLAHQKMKDELVSQEHQNREWARVESEAKAREDTVRTELQMKTSEVASANRALQEAKQQNHSESEVSSTSPVSFKDSVFLATKGPETASQGAGMAALRRARASLASQASPKSDVLESPGAPESGLKATMAALKLRAMAKATPPASPASPASPAASTPPSAAAPQEAAAKSPAVLAAHRAKAPYRTSPLLKTRWNKLEILILQ